MDTSMIHLLVAAVLTVVFVVITALVWTRAQVKTVFWWIGLTLVPMALYLLGLAPAAVGAYQTLRAWWGALQFTPIVGVGLVLAALAALLMLGSRLIPSESYRDRRAAAKAARQEGKVSGSPSRPAVASRPAAPPQPRTQPPAKRPANTGDQEMDEIAELLRKRGIN